MGEPLLETLRRGHAAESAAEDDDPVRRRDGGPADRCVHRPIAQAPSPEGVLNEREHGPKEDRRWQGRKRGLSRRRRPVGSSALDGRDQRELDDDPGEQPDEQTAGQRSRQIAAAIRVQEPETDTAERPDHDLRDETGDARRDPHRVAEIDPTRDEFGQADRQRRQNAGRRAEGDVSPVDDHVTRRRLVAERGFTPRAPPRRTGR